MALSSSGITSDNAALLRQHTMDYLHRNTWWNWRHHQRNKMLRLNYSNAHAVRTAQNFWSYSSHTSSVRAWENLHRHQPRDANSREIITGINSATLRCKVTCNGVPSNLDVDNIVHVHHVSLQQERKSYWNLIIITTVCTITFIGTLCFSLRSQIYRQILPSFPIHKPRTLIRNFKISHHDPYPTQKQGKQPTLIRKRA